MNPYNEQYVLKHLLRDRRFGRFYGRERRKIKGSIAWRLIDLADAVRFHYVAAAGYEDGQRVIRLQRIPVPLEDAGTVAEELAHLVFRETYPGVGALGDVEGYHVPEPQLTTDRALATRLSGLVHERLADQLIAAYGFAPGLPPPDELDGEITDADRSTPAAVYAAFERIIKRHGWTKRLCIVKPEGWLA